MEKKNGIVGLRLLLRVIRETKLSRVLLGFVAFTLAMAFIVMLVEPDINRYTDAVWYLYVTATSIGFGDFYAVTVVGRIVSVLVSLYGLLVIGFIPGVIVSYVSERTKLRANESVMAFLTKLENVDKLSPEELSELAQKVRSRKFKY